VKKRNIIAGVEPISVAEFYLHDHMGRTMGTLDMRTGNWNWYVYADKRIAKLIPDANQQPVFYPDQWSNDSTLTGGGDHILEMHHDFTHFLVKSGKVITTPTDITAIEVEGVHRLFDPEDWNDTLAIDPALDNYVVGRFTITDEDVLFSYSNPATGFDQLLPIAAIDLRPRTHEPGAGGERPVVDPNPDVPSGYWKEHGQALADSVVFYVHDHLGNLRVAYSHELAGCNPTYDTAITIHSIDTTLTFLSSSIDTIVQLTDPNTGEKYFDTIWIDLYDTVFSTNYDTLVTAVMDTQHTALHQALDYYPYGKVLRMLQFDPQRHRLQGNQHDNETGLEYFNARMLETDLVFFRSVDPVFHFGQTPYSSHDGNPILLIDPAGTNTGEYDVVFDENGKETKTKVSTLGDDEGIDFYHQVNGDRAGDTKIVNNNTGQSNWIKGGRDLMRGYSLRDGETSWQSIFEEWKSETGPKNSLIYGRDHPMNEQIRTSNLYHDARNSYLKKQAWDSDGSILKGREVISFAKYMDGFQSVLLSGSNMTLQMMGTVNVSFYDIGNYQRLVMINDSKSVESFDRLGPLSRTLDRVPSRVTRQTYIWIDQNVED